MNREIGRKRSHISKAIIYILAFSLAIVFIYPLIYTIITSFKSNTEIFSNYFGLPQQWVFENYYNAVVKANMFRYFLNSVIVCGSYVAIALMISTMASFALGRIKNKFTNRMLLFFVVGMMVPIHAILIPLAQIAVKLNLSNSYVFLIGVYIAGGVPYMIFVIANFMKQLPVELEEAALLDGAGLWRIFWHVTLPLSKPVIATMGILGLISSWNDLIIALIFIKSDALKTLSLGLLNFTGLFSTDYAGLCAAIVVTSIPIVVVYIMMQEKVEKGLTSGAVKE